MSSRWLTKWADTLGPSAVCRAAAARIRSTGCASWNASFAFAQDALHGWAVGSYGEIEKTADGGRTWAKQVSGVRAHLSVLLGLVMLVKAWGYRLDAYELLLTPGGVVHGLGAGYTEVYARLPALSRSWS